MTRHLRIVDEQAERPLDVTLALRTEIMKRDWDAVHISGDRRKEVFVDDRPKRIWRG